MTLGLLLTLNKASDNYQTFRSTLQLAQGGLYFHANMNIEFMPGNWVAEMVRHPHLNEPETYNQTH